MEKKERKKVFLEEWDVSIIQSRAFLRVFITKELTIIHRDMHCEASSSIKFKLDIKLCLVYNIILNKCERNCSNPHRYIVGV